MSMTTTPPASSDPSGSGAPATDNQIIEGLIAELPPQHSHFPWSKRQAWIEAFEAASHLIWHGSKRLHVSTTPPAPTPSPTTAAPGGTDDDDDDTDTTSPAPTTATTPAVPSDPSTPALAA